jgi:hypothetical protein
MAIDATKFGVDVVDCAFGADAELGEGTNGIVLLVQQPNADRFERVVGWPFFASWGNAIVSAITGILAVTGVLAISGILAVTSVLAISGILAIAGILAISGVLAVGGLGVGLFGRCLTSCVAVVVITTCCGDQRQQHK